MKPDYPAMLRSTTQVQAAMVAAGFNLASRWNQFALQGATTLAKAAMMPILADRDHRQTACEDAIWAAYVAHQQLLRAATGASRLSLLVFLNELDRRRGVRPAP